MLVVGLKEGLVECASVCVKSEIVLNAPAHTNQLFFVGKNESVIHIVIMYFEVLFFHGKGKINHLHLLGFYVKIYG